MGRHASGKRRSRLGEPTAAGGPADDLRLIAHSRRLLAMAVGAVVIIFAVYLAVIALIGGGRDWLLFLIIPAGLSGVSVGALLDRAHASGDARGEANTTEPVNYALSTESASGVDSGAKEREIADQAHQADLAGGRDDEGDA